MDSGGGTSSICLMGYGENNNSNNSSLCPNPMMMMMMMGGGGDHTNNNNNNTNFFLPNPNPNPNPNHHHHNHDDFHRRSSSSASPMMIDNENINRMNHQQQTCYFMENNNGMISPSVKAKIMSHPLYHRLLSAYVNCQKIGAPSEVVGRLEEAFEAAVTIGGRNNTSCIGEDPALDQFMEAYSEMLTKYEQELSKPFKEAMLFLSRIESQFKALSLASSDSAIGDAMDKNGSSEEDVDVVNNNSFIDPQAEDRELKGQLLRKYSGYLGSLKQEFMKKRKKGKLPKEARQQLLEWWSRHYKWPYPSESQKLALAESTGLDQKQINNWFINQRKRHWKPSEDMQFVVMDAAHPHYFMDNVLGNPFPMDISPALL